jgi:hypothetical protein
MALRRHNAEQDYETAFALREHACARLDDEIQYLSSLLAAYTHRSRQAEVAA